MSSTTATGPATPVEAPNRHTRRTKSRAEDAPIVVAVHLRSRSKRGLDWHLYSAKCPACAERRNFTRDGLRLCACGAALFVTVGAEVA